MQTPSQSLASSQRDVSLLLLAFASSLFTYALLLQLTKKRVVALSVALLVLIFPGVMYMTYIPLLEIQWA
jgi:hypothetical protein